MKNAEIATILNEIADFLEQQDVEYKPRAYRRAARNVESLSEPIEDVAERDELESIGGVGESIGEKIQEYLETGTIEYYEDLKAEHPIDIDALTSVEGVGPKTATKLYRELGVTTLEDLEREAEAGRIDTLEGFGETSQQNILDHLELAKRGQERILLGRAFPIAREIESRLAESDAFDRVDVVGSFRRRRATLGDIDILATAADAEAAMDVFCTNEDVNEVLARGETKASIVASGDLHMDLRIVDDPAYGAAKIYFTGSKDHNIALRNRAINRDRKLNEYGLFDVRSVGDHHGDRDVGELLASETEADVYDALELAWIPPELREDTGEVEAASRDELPDLVELDDVRGDLHVHTDYSDGSHTVREMATAASDRGLDYILISDHGPGTPIPETIGADEFDTQREEIRDVNEDDALDVTVLQGIEAEIAQDGLGSPDNVLELCDVVIGALHTRPDDPMGRILDAFESTPIDVFAHPTNRLLNERPPLEIDVTTVLEAAADAEISIEINAQPERLDIDWASVRAHRDTVDFVVSTDAHTSGELEFMHLGVAQARRGWCEPDDLLNTRSIDDLRSRLGA